MKTSPGRSAPRQRPRQGPRQDKPPGGFNLPSHWPPAWRAGAAKSLAERFSELGRDERRSAAQPAFGAMLAAIGGNSPYLADLAVHEAADLRALAASGPDFVRTRAMADLAAMQAGDTRGRIAAALRRAKRRVALVTAIADIGGIWKLETVTQALTELAEATLGLAVAHLLTMARERGEIALPDGEDPVRGCGFTVIGMGKLGAGELNYSSDVDLVLLYDPSAPIYTPATADDAMAGFWARLARGLVGLMETRDADGYVFRTDLRLRPDPAATPPAMSLPAALTYYEGMGQNWERAAMIKARPVAGDLALGRSFLDAIRPFIWRRGLDFAAVADIHAMKQRIDRHRGGALGGTSDPVARIAGHNVKLGEGGIREIEFLVQTLQLVWGGRNPALRDPSTLGALAQLVRAGHVSGDAATELADAYGYLRRVEHRLQMVADRQTHTLPERPDDIAGFSTFMGNASAQEFAETLLRHLTQVSRRYDEAFSEVPAVAGDLENTLDFSGNDAVPRATEAALAALGFANVESIVAVVRGWQAGRVRALRSERARNLISQLLPALLASLARQPQPDIAFNRFEAMIAGWPAGIQLLSLFQRNRGLLDRIAAVLGAAPWLADYLTRHPAALDGLLSPAEDANPERLLARRLHDAGDLGQAIEATRRLVREEEFSLGVATMEGRLDADAAGIARTRLAAAALAALLAPVTEQFATRFGEVRGGAMAVVALGKAGGREMMAGSDLDLMLIYDHPEKVAESAGPRPLAASQYFVRLAQAYIAAVTARGIDGPLYAADMRLRPSGNQGPVAVSLASFRLYHAQSAWTWERMALTRARVVAGPPALARRVEAAIAEALSRPMPARSVLDDVAAMRARLTRDLPPSSRWDVKLRPGGQIDVEFVAQALQLAHAGRRLFDPTTRVALNNLAGAGILAGADAALLIRADRIWRTVQGMLRITQGRSPVNDLPEASARPLLRAVGEAGATGKLDNTAGLLATLDFLAQDVGRIFQRVIGVTPA